MKTPMQVLLAWVFGALTAMGAHAVLVHRTTPAPVVPYAAIEITQCGVPLALMATYSNGGYEGATLEQPPALIELLMLVKEHVPEDRRIAMRIPPLQDCPPTF